MKIPAFVCNVCRDHIAPPPVGPHMLPGDPHGVGVGINPVTNFNATRLTPLALLDADIHLCKRCVISIEAMAKELYGKEKK